MNSKRSIATVLTLLLLLGITGACVYVTAAKTNTTTVTDDITQELMPMMAMGCPATDAETLHELFDKLGYTYEGVGNKTVLNGGYSYTTGYSHNYINVYIYDGDQLKGSYRISTIG